MLGHTEPDAEPWPIILPGEAKPIPSTKVGEYVNKELIYYAEFYSNYRHAGAPFSGGWADWPPWCVQIIRTFDSVVDTVRAWREQQAYKKARVK